MSNKVDDIVETTSNLVNSTSEIVKDRIFSPMYFYFLGSWIVVNWEFVYTLLFVEETTILEHKSVFKIEYLADFYSIASIGDAGITALKLLILPLVSAFVFVWWITKLSEVFHRKYEQHQSNKRIIKREIEYTEKVKDTRQQREIREEEFDVEPQKDIRYEDNQEFNEYVDEENRQLEVSGVSLLSSEALYKTDYQGYKDLLYRWADENNKVVHNRVQDVINDAERKLAAIYSDYKV